MTTTEQQQKPPAPPKIEDYGDRPPGARKDQVRLPTDAEPREPAERERPTREPPPQAPSSVQETWGQVVGEWSLVRGTQHEDATLTALADAARLWRSNTPMATIASDIGRSPAALDALDDLKAQVVLNWTLGATYFGEFNMQLAATKRTDDEGKVVWRIAPRKSFRQRYPIDPFDVEPSDIGGKRREDVAAKFRLLKDLPNWNRYSNSFTGKCYCMTQRDVGGRRRKLSPDFPSFAAVDEWLYEKGGFRQVIENLLLLKHGWRDQHLRRQFGRERVGAPVSTPANAADPDSKYLAERFGLRAVEWGNHVPQRERRELVVRANEALTDLAMLLGIKCEQIGLGQRLTIAFGSRGHGGKNPAAAHYEHATQAINLTREHGAGTLAHEWFHAFDHAHDWRVSDKLRAQFRDQRSGCEFLDACEGMDKLSGKRNSSGEPYYACAKEVGARVFEDWCFRRLNDFDALSPMLVERSDETQWKHCMDFFSTGGEKSTYPYPTDANHIALQLPLVELISDELAALDGIDRADLGVLAPTSERTGQNWDNATYESRRQLWNAELAEDLSQGLGD